MKNQKIKLVIFAGGYGSRLSEETYLKPKPMIEIGGQPILWHIMKIYSYFGINDFIICCGYKGESIKEYFYNYKVTKSDLFIDLISKERKVFNNYDEPWKIRVIDTGINTQTGGRLKKIKKYVKDDDFFCLTYGDGLANINIHKLIQFHKKHKKLATVSACFPHPRFGVIKLSKENRVTSFKEKPNNKNSYINGGYFVLSPKVIDYIKNDKTIWEAEPLEILSRNKNLMAFRHNDFWHPMDTLRDKIYLEKLWKSKKCPWKIWN